MTQRTWKLNIDATQHEVLLKHGLIPGREIWLDGKLIEKGWLRWDFGSDHFFSVGDHPAELGIVSTPCGYEYFLRVDQEFVFSTKDKKQTVGKHVRKKLKEKDRWIALGKQYGLSYSPSRSKRFVYSHRLIGYANGHLLTIEPGLKSVGEAALSGLVMVLRHASIDDERKELLQNERDLKKLIKEWPIRKGDLQITPNFTSLFLQIIPKNEEEEIAFDFLFEFIAVAIKYLKPTLGERCEGLECRARLGQALRLTMINGIPYLICQDCIDSIGNVGKKSQEEYKKAPSHLFRGILYGLGGMLLGALLWALIFIFLDRIGAIVAVFSFFIIIKAMDYAKAKRTFTSLSVASILAVCSSILGTYFGIIGYLLREKEINLNLEALLRVAKWILEDPSILSEAIVFSLFGIIPYLFIIWNANRSHLKSAFNPRIEVIPTFSLPS